MQRRADFMADVGEETAFGFRGGVGRLHGLLELGVEALEILGLGAFFQFGGQPLGTFLNLAPELEIPENDQQQDGQDDFNAEQAGPECARGKVERRLAAEPAVVDEFPLGRLDLVQGFGEDAVQLGPVRAHADGQAALGGDGRGRLKPQMRVVFQLGQDAGLVVDQRVGMPGHDPEQPLQGIADRVQDDVGITAFKVIVPVMPVYDGNPFPGELLEAGGVLRVFMDHDDAGEGNMGPGKEQVCVDGKRRFHHGEQIRPPLLGVFERRCPVGLRLYAELDPDNAGKKPQIVKADARIGVELLGIGQRDEGWGHAYGNDGVFIYPCLFFGGEQLRHGRHGREHTDGRFQRREIAVVRRVLRDQQHMPCKQDEYDEYGAEENKNTHKLLAEKTAQEGTPVWQRCTVRSRGHLVVAPSVDYGGGGACFPEARHSYEKDETMRIDEVKRQLEAFGVLDGYREFATSSATVELAAAGCEPGRIAKTLSFKTAEGPIVIVVMGTARIDNRKFKDQFKEKAKFPQGEEVESLIGHPIGGVCPFAVNEGVRVFLDLSLKAFDPVYPAAGAPNNAVCLSLADLERVTGGTWVDVCKQEAE